MAESAALCFLAFLQADENGMKVVVLSLFYADIMISIIK